MKKYIFETFKSERNGMAVKTKEKVRIKNIKNNKFRNLNKKQLRWRQYNYKHFKVEISNTVHPF